MITVSRKKIFVAIALILSIGFSSTLVNIRPAEAAGLKDLNQCADYAKPSVERLTESGIVSGYDNGYFYPQQTITRGQMITLIVKSLGLNNSITPEHNDTFKDVPQNHWANKYVEIAYQTGITRGIAPGQFGVNQTCTREQMITLLVNTFKILDNEFTKVPSGLTDLTRYADGAQISDWARDPVAFSVYMGLISGTGANTMSPQAGAQRQQVAVLTDLFIGKKANIVTDMKAQRMLGKTMQEQLKGQGLANTGELEIKATLQQAIPGLPAELSLKANLANEIIWPATLHQTVNAELTGLPGNAFSQLEMNQYLADGVLYQKNGNSQSSWVRTPAKDASAVARLMENAKNAQVSQLMLPDELHKSAQVKIEAATVNGASGNKITYQGQFTDASGWLDQLLPATLPSNMDNSQIQDLLAAIKSSVDTINLTEVFYIGADNLIYGSDLSISINCKDSANIAGIPLKNINITGKTENYKYNDISIVLPTEAKNAL